MEHQLRNPVLYLGASLPCEGMVSSEQEGVLVWVL